MQDSPLSSTTQETDTAREAILINMASSFLASAAQQLGGLMATEFKHLHGVSDKIKLLQKELKLMDGFLEDAYNKQHSNKLVANWVDEVRDCAYEAQEILEKYVHKVSHPRQNGSWNSIRWMFCALSDVPALHEVGSDIDKLITRLEGLKSSSSLYGVNYSIKEGADIGSGSTLSIWDQRQTYSHINKDPIGLEKQTRTVAEQLLMNKQVKVVGICGMGGLGKTTLATQVFQDTETSEHFKKRAWVCISKRFEARDVFRNILLELTNANERKGLRDLTDGELPSKICEILKQNSCLVVLDDVWSIDDWKALKPAFDSITTSPSSKILITTRNNGLLHHGDSSEHCHSLDLLSDDDSWNLFRRIALLDGENSDSDNKAKQKLGWKMLKHCKGLPLAILTLGGVLSSKKTIAEWEKVQKNLTSYLMGDMEPGADNKELFAMLELSYHDLPSYLKPCFLYLGVFPEDHAISAHKLYHLWVCDIMDLRKMTSLRVVSFDSSLSVEEVEHLLKSPVICRRRLVKPLHLKVEADVINDAGKSLLAEIQSLVCIDKFDVRGKIDEATNLEILQKMNLTELSLQDSRIDPQGISILEKLIHLKKLVLERKSIGSSKLRFCNGSFKELEALHMSCLYRLEEWEIEEGALPKLKFLEIHGCPKLKMIPQGLPKSVFVDCFAPCVSGVENYYICPHTLSGFYEDLFPRMKIYHQYLLYTMRIDAEAEELEAGQAGLVL